MIFIFIRSVDYNRNHDHANPPLPSNANAMNHCLCWLEQTYPMITISKSLPLKQVIMGKYYTLHSLAQQLNETAMLTCLEKRDKMVCDFRDGSTLGWEENLENQWMLWKEYGCWRDEWSFAAPNVQGWRTCSADWIPEIVGMLFSILQEFLLELVDGRGDDRCLDVLANLFEVFWNFLILIFLDEIAPGTKPTILFDFCLGIIECIHGWLWEGWFSVSDQVKASMVPWIVIHDHCCLHQSCVEAGSSSRWLRIKREWSWHWVVFEWSSICCWEWNCCTIEHVCGVMVACHRVQESWISSVSID